MTIEEAKTFLDNLKVCIEEHPIVADWLVEIADRKTEPQTHLLVTEYPQDGEVTLIGRDKTEAVVMAYDVYKELTEPQTDIGTSDTVYSDTAGYVPRVDMTDCSWK